MRHKHIGMLFLAVALLGSSGHVHAQALQWREITPQTGPQPEARRYGTAIYDAAAHRVVVFGGLGVTGFLNDVWAFDVAARTWTRLQTTGAAPAPRFGHNAVYDAVGRQMLVWAGQQSSRFFDDTWSLDLQTLAWRDVSPGRRPRARYGAAAVFDPTARRLVQFAGFTSESVRYQDTQAFDVRSSSWTDLTPPGALPQVRCLHTAAFDPVGRRMIVFGGQRSGALGDFWSFDLQTGRWTALNTTGGPSARYFSTSFVDATGAFVVFGGTSASGDTDDTWVFNFENGQWSRLETAVTPGARSGMMGAYVESERRFIVFGGNAAGRGLVADVWELAQPASPVEASLPSITKTAVIVVNPGSQPADLTFFFTDTEGQDIAGAATTLPPGGQLARFLHEAPFSGPTPFRGTFTLRSTQPVVLAALKGFLSAAAGFAGAALPVVDLAAPLAATPALAPVVTNGGGWSSELVMINPTDETLMGSVRFSPVPGSASIPGRGLPYVIPARSVRTLQRIGAGDAPETAWAMVNPADGQPSPTVLTLLSYTGEAPSGTRTAFPQGTLGTSFRLYAESQ